MHIEHASRAPGQSATREWPGLASLAVLLLAVYALWFLAASPQAEFPLNDDWAYAQTVRHLLATGQLHISEWAAPPVIVQTYAGALSAWLSGGFSFTALRLSTLVCME